jgi:class 3 adenylate cyclase
MQRLEELPLNEIDPELFIYHFGNKPSVKDVVARLNSRISGVYVLSIDICSYSAFVHATPDLQVAMNMLHEFCDRCREAVIETGGAIDRVTGDSVLAFWGLLGEVDYRIPLDAGFRLLEIAEEIATRWQDEIDEVISPRGARAGLSHGEVTFMTMASAYPGFSLLGDVVNLAARLQAVAEPGSLLISNRFRKMIEDMENFEVLPIDDGDDKEGIIIKNMGSVHAYSVALR